MKQESHKAQISNRASSGAKPVNKLVNNKEGRPFEFYNARYRQLDPEEVSQRCGVLFNKDKGVFELDFIGNRYEIAFPEFYVSVIDKRVPADRLSELGAAQILIIRYLLEGRLEPALGKFLTYREMPWGSVYNDNFTGRCIKRLAFSYGNSQEQFKRIMEALGAKPVKGGDIAYELELLKGLFIRYILWAGDDEFPPSSQILFSDNFPSAFTAEDMAVVGDVTIDSMKQAEE